MDGGVFVTEPISQSVVSAPQERTDPVDDPLNQIRDLLRGLRFGSVNIIVQDGVVVQIDRTEKRRMRGNRSSST
jgi:hypothetical protein